MTHKNTNWNANMNIVMGFEQYDQYVVFYYYTLNFFPPQGSLNSGQEMLVKGNNPTMMTDVHRMIY